MRSRVGRICEATAAYLRTQDFGVATDFTAQHVNLGYVRQEEAASPVCFVTPAGMAQTVATRRSWAWDYEIALVLVKAMFTDTIEEQDDLMFLGEQLPNVLVNGPAMAGARLDTIEDEGSRVIYEAIELNQYNFFTAAVSVFFHDEGVI